MDLGFGLGFGQGFFGLGGLGFGLGLGGLGFGLGFGFGGGRIGLGGLGFGLGTQFGLIYIELTAVIVFLVQIVLSRLWLRYFRFGPLEWLWRICTYGQYYQIKA